MKKPIKCTTKRLFINTTAANCGNCETIVCKPSHHMLFIMRRMNESPFLSLAVCKHISQPSTQFIKRHQRMSLFFSAVVASPMFASRTAVCLRSSLIVLGKDGLEIVLERFSRLSSTITSERSEESRLMSGIEVDVNVIHAQRNFDAILKQRNCWVVPSVWLIALSVLDNVFASSQELFPPSAEFFLFFFLFFQAIEMNQPTQLNKLHQICNTQMTWKANGRRDSTQAAIGLINQKFFSLSFQRSRSWPAARRRLKLSYVRSEGKAR